MIDGPKEICLHVPQVEERAQYACLSHCWGGHVAIQTNAATLDEFRTGIPWEKLPLTFQHAIDMTHRLGLKFLWIDSLCIVQDDINDWRHEGSRMASIYSQAHITLAAANASDSNQGFYNTPSADENATTFTVENDDGSLCTIAVNYEPISSGFSQGHLPLLRRGWFFQERSLSPRVVHFADNRLYWECLALREGERGVSVHKSIEKGGQMVRGTNPPLPPGQKDNSCRCIEKRRWHSIVQRYSEKHLTFRKDVLPALQGVASYIHQSRQCAYYAGLWADNLPFDLLWRVTNLPRSTPKSYDAPTWSWASRPHPVSWPVQRPNFQPHASVLAVSTTPAGSDPMGEVVAERLELKGKCIAGVVKLVYMGTWTSRWDIELSGTTGKIAFQYALDYNGEREWYPDYDKVVADG